MEIAFTTTPDGGCWEVRPYSVRHKLLVDLQSLEIEHVNQAMID